MNPEYYNRYHSEKNWYYRVVLLEVYHFHKSSTTPGWVITNTCKDLKISLGLVSESLQLAEAIHIHPEIMNAKSRQEAMRLMRNYEVRPSGSLTFGEEMNNYYILVLEDFNSASYLKELRNGVNNPIWTDDITEAKKWSEEDLNKLLLEFQGEKAILATSEMADEYSIHMAYISYTKI